MMFADHSIMNIELTYQAKRSEMSIVICTVVPSLPTILYYEKIGRAIGGSPANLLKKLMYSKHPTIVTCWESE
jgi:hypothetical protein